MKKKLIVLLVVLSVVLAACGGPAAPAPATPAPSGSGAAENQPEATEGSWQPAGNVTALVGQAVGGGLDTLKRMLIPGLQEELGANIVPQNMPGANASIAAASMMSNPPDGNTIFVWSSGSMTFPASALSDYDYRDIRMLAIAQATNPVICVPIDSPFTTVEEWIEAVRGGETTASNSGLGGLYHIPQLVIVNAIGGTATYIAYDGGRPAVTAAAQGEVDWSISDIGEALPLIEDGLVRALAIHALEDVYLEGIGTVPSILHWLPELEEIIPHTRGFRGVGIRRDTPEHIAQAWIEALRVVVNSPEVVDGTTAMGITPVAIFGDDADRMTEETTYLVSWLLYDMGYAQRSPAEVGLERR
ncbi:MAG: tripartite tricarboxylate transporter substrate binding protein [Oscillospiraceae bacterium]|nr:tripartite tricarboxylate transporter substrate binding protein [Oscillospiraceae bacterium]